MGMWVGLIAGVRTEESGQLLAPHSLVLSQGDLCMHSPWLTMQRGSLIEPWFALGRLPRAP